MKINIFVPTRSGGKFTDYSFNYSSITGEELNGPQSFEDGIIAEIDESRMSPEKLLAVRFLSFLASRYISIYSLKDLSPKEQRRLKREFNESN